jgi:uncharacterized protein (DUF433 family)
MADLDRITFDPTRTNGQACIRDLRITVRRSWVFSWNIGHEPASLALAKPADSHV